MNSPAATDQFPYDTPPWRSSYTAVSPDGAVVATIDQTVEHSMGNPTTGILKVSNGLELSGCSPVFLWSEDSKYLAVPRWCRRFGLFRRQRLVIVDVSGRTAFVSPFTRWMFLPTSFQGGRLQVLVSDWRGIPSVWKEHPLVLEVPSVFATFRLLKGGFLEPQTNP